MALAVAAIFGALAAWIVYTTASAFDLVPPHIPWSAPGGLVLIAAVVGIIAYTTHQRVQVRRQRMEPQRAVAFLVLGKASALAGALVAGGYLTYALLFVARVEAEAPRDRVIRSGLAVLTGIGLCVAGLLLERACRVPRDEGGDRDDTAGDDEPTVYDPS
jgi:Protein of unknown function (DUF3180)